MGFRKDTYATVWSADPISDTLTKVRISISRKNKDTGEYEQSFGDFTSFVGSANAAKALALKPKDRIRLGDVDVTNRYDKEKGVTYTNFFVYSFEMADEPPRAQTASVDPGLVVDSGETDGSDDLPF